MLFVLIRPIYCSYDWLVQQRLIFIIIIMVWDSHVNTAALIFMVTFHLKYVSCV